MLKLKNKIIIAIDGYSSTGKSTFAKAIAKLLDYIYVDSGAMYRAAALFAMRNNLVSGNTIDTKTLIARLPDLHICFKKKQDRNHTWLNDEDVEEEIRGMAVSSFVSIISKIKEVRQHMVQLQKKLGEGKGVVMDGRDIGTVVFPDAELKIFMTADVNIRAHRRFIELKDKGILINLEETKNNISERDFQDIHREESPLRQAEDAFVLDNSLLRIDEQMHWFEELLKAKNLI